MAVAYTRCCKTGHHIKVPLAGMIIKVLHRTFMNQNRIFVESELGLADVRLLLSENFLIGRASVWLGLVRIRRNLQVRKLFAEEWRLSCDVDSL